MFNPGPTDRMYIYKNMYRKSSICLSYLNLSFDGSIPADQVNSTLQK